MEAETKARWWPLGHAKAAAFVAAMMAAFWEELEQYRSWRSREPLRVLRDLEADNRGLPRTSYEARLYVPVFDVIDDLGQGWLLHMRELARKFLDFPARQAANHAAPGKAGVCYGDWTPTVAVRRTRTELRFTVSVDHVGLAAVPVKTCDPGAAYRNCLRALGHTDVPKVDLFGDGIPEIARLADCDTPAIVQPKPPPTAGGAPCP